MSRLRSARGASRPAAAAPAARPAGRRPGVFVQAPRSDIYVALLGIALGAILLGCILLVLVLNGYEFKVTATAMSGPPSGIPAAVAGIPTTVHL